MRFPSKLKSLNGQTQMLINRLTSAQSALDEIKGLYPDVYISDYIAIGINITKDRLRSAYKKQRADILTARRLRGK